MKKITIGTEPTELDVLMIGNYIAAILGKASTAKEGSVVIGDCFSASALRAMFIEFKKDFGTKAKYVILNAKEYADLRKFDKSELAIETWAKVLMTGLMARIDGVPLICSRSVISEVILAGKKNGEFVVSKTKLLAR